MDYLSNFPHFLGYFIEVVLLSILFLTVYVWLTPNKELTLIQGGNLAASIQLVGTFMGFAISLAAVVSHSVNMIDVAIWGIIALVVQVITFWSICQVLKNTSSRIRDNWTSAGVFVGGLSLGVGILQAACMVP